MWLTGEISTSELTCKFTACYFIDVKSIEGICGQSLKHRDFNIIIIFKMPDCLVIKVILRKLSASYKVLKTDPN